MAAKTSEDPYKHPFSIKEN